jgi:hypothetical protein
MLRSCVVLERCFNGEQKGHVEWLLLSSLFSYILGFGKASGVTDVKGSCFSALALQPISEFP